MNQRGDQSSGGTGAMAQARLDRGTQLAKRAMVFDDFEDRIIAKTVVATGLKGYPTGTTALAFGPNSPGPVP